MKIKCLEINNFRAISNLTIDFEPDKPNVFIGINGVGKSSILDCLAILLSCFTSSLQNLPSNGLSLRDEDITNGKSETSNQITISLNIENTIEWTLKRSQKINNGDLSELNTVISEMNEKLKSSDNYSLPVFLYYPTNRAVLDIPLKIRTRPLLERINAYDQCLNGIDFRNFFAWFREREDLENEERLNNNNIDYRDEQLESVRRAITSVMEGFNNLRVKRSPLLMVLEKQGKELIINQLSDGEKCLLAMVGDIARRLAIANPSNNPLHSQGIILIDEIELHLHPKWQRKIIPSLCKTFPNCQFIITTHSPQVISHVDEVFLLEETSEGITLEKFHSYGKDSNRILETLMDTGERPQEVQEKLSEVFKVIETGNLEEAKNLRKDLNKKIGDDPLLSKADVLIKRKEILKDEIHQ